MHKLYRYRNTFAKECKSCRKVHKYITSGHGWLSRCGTPIQTERYSLLDGMGEPEPVSFLGSLMFWRRWP